MSQYRHRRFASPAATFPTLEPGEISTNTANRTLAVGDANTATAGQPVMLLAVRFFDVRASYATGDIVVNNAIVYRALTNVSPAAFNGSQWEIIAGGAGSTAYVAKSGDTMTGPLILSGDPSAALGAATKQYADTGDTAAKNFATAGDTTVTTNFQAADTLLQTSINAKVSKNGDTMSGPLTISSGGITVNAGGVNITAGGLLVTGTATINGFGVITTGNIASQSVASATNATNATYSTYVKDGTTGGNIYFNFSDVGAIGPGSGWYLWAGTGDGAQYVVQPSNLSVAFANSAGPPAWGDIGDTCLMVTGGAYGAGSIYTLPGRGGNYRCNSSSSIPGGYWASLFVRVS